MSTFRFTLLDAWTRKPLGRACTWQGLVDIARPGSIGIDHDTSRAFRFTAYSENNGYLKGASFETLLEATASLTSTASLTRPTPPRP